MVFFGFFCLSFFSNHTLYTLHPETSPGETISETKNSGVCSNHLNSPTTLTFEKALELIGPRVQLTVAAADDQARNSPLDTALSSSSESIERNLNMALNNGQFYPGIFEQTGDVSLAMPDLGLFGFDVAGHLSTDGGVLGETRYYLDPSRQ